MSLKLKIMILIGSLVILGFSIYQIATIGDVQASTSTHVYAYDVSKDTVVPVTDGISLNVGVATAGDAGFQTKTRSNTDIYNVLVLIAIELMFWIMWNVVRTVYRILCDFKKF